MLLQPTNLRLRSLILCFFHPTSYLRQRTSGFSDHYHRPYINRIPHLSQLDRTYPTYSKMAGPNAVKRPQSNRTRPKSVAIAVPLKYEKKSQKAVTPDKNQNNVTTTKVEDISSPATTSETFYTPATASTRTTDCGSSPSQVAHTLTSEHFEISLPSQENPEHQQGSSDPGITSSWAGNAQSTCIIEPDQGKTYINPLPPDSISRLCH